MKTITVDNEKKENLDSVQVQLRNFCMLHLTSIFSVLGNLLRKENSNPVKSLDLLVVGYDHHSFCRYLMEELPNFTSKYVNVDCNIHLLERIFILYRPKRTLIMGELDGKVEKHDRINLLNVLLNLKKPEQKIVISGFKNSDRSNYIKLPFTPETLQKKFNEMK